MTKEPSEQVEMMSLREVIENFIQKERLRPKLEKLDKEIEKRRLSGEHEKVTTLLEDRGILICEYQRENWLEGAANKSNQIKIATHAPKYLHPDAKGSSIYLDATKKRIGEHWVSTHTLGKQRVDDMVGNAAALDVYKLLKLEFKGRTVLQRVEEKSSDLVAALSDEEEKAVDWIEKFAAVLKEEEELATHSQAKQLYFPISNEDYHLLAPLFPTSLVQAVYSHFQKTHFSETAKEAREAKRNNQLSTLGYIDYPNLAAQAFGGNQPQNISQLNSKSKRGGKVWLLPSCPPTWRTAALKPPLHVETVFGRWFGGRRQVREHTKSLAMFLTSTDYNNVNIRRTREKMVDLIVDELVQFSAELHQLNPGWSAKAECKLNRAETLWLDPGRAIDDESFASQRINDDWRLQVASRFGSWLNKQLRFFSKRRGVLSLGDIEHRVWQNVAEHALKMLRTELSYDE